MSKLRKTDKTSNKNMNARDYSILRREQYKHLFRIKFSGEILDLGGDVRNNYHESLKGDYSLDIANLDPDSGANLIFDFTDPFPIADGKYDKIICLNVLEHVFDFNAVLREAHRILKENGQIIVSTPFLYRVHGAPDDYFRYTESALVKILSEHGFKKIIISPLGGGMFSVLAQHVSGMVPTIFLRNIFRHLCLLLDASFLKIMPRYGLFVQQTTLGYFVVAEK